MAEDLIVSDRLVIPAGELRERFSHSSGPGGQGVNTADSRVELAFDLAGSSAMPEDLKRRMSSRLRSRLAGGVVVVVAQEYRSQLSNRRAARQRLAQLLREAAAPPARRRRSTTPTRGSMERRLASKKRRGEIKRGRRSTWD